MLYSARRRAEVSTSPATAARRAAARSAVDVVDVVEDERGAVVVTGRFLHASASTPSTLVPVATPYSTGARGPVGLTGRRASTANRVSFPDPRVPQPPNVDSRCSRDGGRR